MARKSDYTAADLVRVDELTGGETIRGTGASGLYEDGPRVLARIDEAPPRTPFRTEHRLHFEGGRSVVYFGSTQVITGRATSSNP